MMAKFTGRIRNVYQRRGLVALLRSIGGVLGAKLRHFMRSVRILSRHVRNRIRYDAVAEPYKVLFVDPNQIRLFSRELQRWEMIGRVVGGDWDTRPRQHAEHPKHRAIEKHFLHDTAWDDTGIYDVLMPLIHENGRFDGCEDLEDLRRRYNLLDKTYNSMKRSGFDVGHVAKKPLELSKSLSRWWDDSRYGYICVNIGRDGQLIHADGANHRLSIAKILTLDEVPVLVLMRHRRWQKLREEIKNARHLSQLSEEALRHVAHPDMQDVAFENVKGSATPESTYGQPRNQPHGAGVR